jgi:hypothetical protein
MEPPGRDGFRIRFDQRDVVQPWRIRRVVQAVKDLMRRARGSSKVWVPRTASSAKAVLSVIARETGSWQHTLDSTGRPLTSQSSASHCQTRTQSTRSSCG